MQRLNDINLSKLKKCDQIWGDMTPNEKGRICTKCQNTIIDFRNLSKSKIAEIHAFSEEKVCGLYRKDQLQISKSPRFKLSKLKGIAAGIIGFLISTNTNAQIKADSIPTIQIEPNYEKKDSVHSEQQNSRKVVNDSIIISGTLTDESGEPLIRGSIHIKETKTFVVSNLSGYYLLDISEELDSLNQITIVYSYVGYRQQEIILDKETLKTPKDKVLNIVFQEGIVQEFYIVYKRPLHKRLRNGIKRIFKKKK